MAFKQLKAEPLRDGCSADELSARCNKFIRDINPYLEQPKDARAVVR